MFEHRDLHWGNVLVKETKEIKQVQFILDGDIFEVNTEGVVTNIIDFSLSRLTMNDATIFSDKTNDPTLFTAKVKIDLDVKIHMICVMITYGIWSF